MSISTQALRNAVDALMEQAQGALEDGNWELVAALLDSAAEIAEGCFK